MGSSRHLLFVHPYNHVLDELVPMGAVALVNRWPGPKLGRYAWELTEDDLASAGCVALDLHWYFSIEAVRWIAADIKGRFPDLPVVLGGITASFYARTLIERFPVDYIVQGDGEHAFPRLVDALLSGRAPPPLPNVWTRQGPPPSRQPVRGEEYDANDYLTLDWFPTLQQWTRRNHAEYGEQPFWGRMDRYHPYIPLNRGCRFPCNGCFGAYQRDVFGPGQVDRGAESLARLLDGAEAHPDYRFVNLTAGTEDMARLRPLRDVFARRRALGAYVMHFCDLPSDDDLALILGGFERVCMDFTNPADVPLPLRAQGLSIAQAEDRILDISRALDGLEHVRVGVSFMSTEPHPFKDRLRAVDWQRLELKENSEWTLPRPNHATLQDAAGEVDADDAQATLALAAERRAQAAGPPADLPSTPLPSTPLPRFPLPSTERRGLSPAQQAARHRAKAAQADAFRAVSQGHARYLLARALAPSLHVLLDQSTQQQVDGADVAALRIDDPHVQAFVDAYRARWRTWFVHTLGPVDVMVRALWTAPDAPGLTAATDAPGSTAANDGVDLGPATVRPSYDGLRVAWQGTLPAACTGVALRPVVAFGGAGSDASRTLDPLVLGLPLLALPAAPGDAGLFARVGPAGCRFSLHDRVDPTGTRLPDTSASGAPRAAFAWQVAELLPPTPWDPKADEAPPDAWGPTDLVEQPWPDTRWPERVGRLLDRAIESPVLDGWAGTCRERSTRWVCHELEHRTGVRLRTFVVPPGAQRCAWQGRRGRLLVQDDTQGASETGAGQALIGVLARLLSGLEARG